MRASRYFLFFSALSLVACSSCPPCGSEVGDNQLEVVGWKESASLPELGISSLIVKVDSGAKTSSLHAEQIQEIKQGDQTMVQFKVFPNQDSDQSILATAPLFGYREVKDSGAKVTVRPVIITPVRIGEREWNIELTLVGRDQMGFRMLLGRQAIRNSFIIDPGKGFLHGKRAACPPKKPTI